jgi:hypothetical protein
MHATSKASAVRLLQVPVAVSILFLVAGCAPRSPAAPPTPPQPPPPVAAAAAPVPAAHAAYQPGLGELMLLMGERQSRLAASIAGHNPPLAQFEFDELAEVLDDVRSMYPTHEKLAQPSAELIAAHLETSLAQIKAGLDAKDWGAAGVALGKLTAGCNDCHEASQVGFIHILVPKQPPVSNQQFSLAAPR